MTISIQEQDQTKGQNHDRNPDQDSDIATIDALPRHVLIGQIVHARKCYKRLFFIDLRIDDSVKHTILFRSDDCRQDSYPLLLPESLSDQELISRWKRIKRGDWIEIEAFAASEDEIAKREHKVFQAVDFKVLKPWPHDDPFPVEPALGLKTHTKSDQKSIQSQSDKDQELQLETEDDNGSGTTSWRDYCKFWINSQKCLLGPVCRSKHPTGDEYARIREIWVKERVQARRERVQQLILPDDPHTISSKVPHSQRAFIFARWLVEKFGKDFLNSGYGVLDVAGGKGEISLFLTHMFSVRSTVVEPQRRNDKSYKRKLLLESIHKLLEKAEEDAQTEDEKSSKCGVEEVWSDQSSAASLVNKPSYSIRNETEEEKRERRQLKKQQIEAFVVPRLHTLLDDQFVVDYPGVIENASILIGMHPDQATEPIVDMALKHKKPFAIVPCCVFPHENPDRRQKDGGRVNTTLEFIQYLVDKVKDAPTSTADDTDTREKNVSKAFLPFDGMNIVISRALIATPTES
ncbi:hypothetical protein BGZ83_007368 [Gryganskiella cystojenkinii]|nr:hypothetical protein BGZ83_007368 [Gryganskiella cystojenkinii]